MRLTIRRALATAVVAVLAAAGLHPSVASAQTPPHRFPDVPSGVFYDAPVRWMQGEGLTTGYGSTGRFLPNRTVTRAEAATFIWRLEGSPAPSDPNPAFPDVPPGTYFTPAVSWMLERGITTGVGATGQFRPGDAVTRAQVATMFHRLAGLPAGAPTQRFADVPAGSYFDAAVRWMTAAGLTTGVGGSDRFEPHRELTRGELATFLWRFAGEPPAPDLPPAPFERVFTHHRLVALYGLPGAPVLGGLGSQDLDASVARVRAIAASFPNADGRTAVPTFEIITTLASASAGADGDYSHEIPISRIRPWVDRARDEGFYVVLDLQSGRTDFLTQARQYEELLREPHVGLALDPEWRLGPGEVHGSVGTVSAAEVQATADWLAGVVRDNGLPPKPFIVHQFRIDMFPDRHLFVPPPELDAVIQMDGIGTQAQKDNTWRALNGYGAADRFWWGWKNFYDDDTPVATPQKMEALIPAAVFVSYQ
jgi:hypothetical protein